MLILASASPQRRKLLEQLGVPFVVAPPDVHEPAYEGHEVSPRGWAEALAFMKCSSVAAEHPDDWILGADTIVACGGEVLGKPADEADARRMLELQVGQVCDVITGVCLARGDPAVQRFLLGATTRVWMRDNRAAIETYLQSGDWRGKAGAYGIQSAGGGLVERIEGSFSNVVGLPLEVVRPMLVEAGLLAA
jgi:septum formation protein